MAARSREESSEAPSRTRCVAVTTVGDVMRLGTETVEGTAGALESVDNVEGRDGLPVMRTVCQS